MFQVTDKMEALKNDFEAIISNVQTYIQSGNVVDAEEENAAAVDSKLTGNFFKVLVMKYQLLLVRRFRSMFQEQPFLKEKEIDTQKLYVAFISTHSKYQYE
jgi:uncharacterized protein (DUF1697 family)